MDSAAPTVQLMYFHAGGGHASAARALRTALQARLPAASIELVDLAQVLDAVDILRQLTGIRLHEGYNRLLEREWTWGFSSLARVLQATIALRYRSLRDCLVAFWRQHPPDLVVSVIPHFNPVMVEALRVAVPVAPLAVVITDFADTPPGFWLTGAADRVFCGTARAAAQARDAGFAPDRITRVSGMVLRPEFYQNLASDAAPAARASERLALGLAPEVPTALVLLGGAGSRRMMAIAHRLDRLPLPLQLILLCGKDEVSARRLRSEPSRHVRWVEGFTERVPHFMRIADFFIGKPGPGALSEAIDMHLPALVVCNRRTMPQERYNAQWLEENGVGRSLSSWRQIDRAVAEMLRPGVLDAYRARTCQIQNRAVFEIADGLVAMLDSSLQRSEAVP